METLCTLGSTYSTVGSPFVYVAFNKPYGVLSQFTKEVEEHTTLADFLSLPSDVYPIGRLDKDSEGLLLLTNDNSLKTKLLDPASNKVKTYLTQLDGDITPVALDKLRHGITIRINKKNYQTKPAVVTRLPGFSYPQRQPPVRYRAEIPTSWIEISISEGKNRQIRRMGAAVGFPVLRLIRTSFAGISIPDLQPGAYRPLTFQELSIL